MAQTLPVGLLAALSAELDRSPSKFDLACKQLKGKTKALHAKRNTILLARLNDVGLRSIVGLAKVDTRDRVVCYPGYGSRENGSSLISKKNDRFRSF
jgi:hypothetical protein